MPSAPARSPSRRRYLRSRHVLERYGRDNPVWLWRRLKNDPAFPRPIYIGGIRYWDLDSLEAFEAACAAQADAAA